MRKSARFSIWILIVILSAGTGLAVADDTKPRKEPAPKKSDAAKPAGEASKPAEPSAKGDDDSVPTYTNEDLERMFGGEPVEAPAATPAGGEAAAGKTPAEPKREAPTDALEWMKQRQERAKERTAAIAEAQKAVADLEAKVKDLQKRLLAIRNPYLARPQVSEEDEPDWKDLDAERRVQRTEKELNDARAQLAEARSRLSQLEATRP